VAVLGSSNGVDHINKVTLLWAQLVLGLLMSLDGQTTSIFHRPVWVRGCK